MKKEILRSRDILSRKIQRLLSCHFSPRTLGGSCQEKEDPGKSGIKCEHINGRNDRFLTSCNVRPVAIPENLCGNTRIRLLATHSLVSVFETSLLRKYNYFRRNKSPPQKISVLRGNESPPLK